ncbi:MAG: hypothetical protein DRO00_04515 [Thermoproteota archaeon]|nr:MAG: hypothetical protein DRO00_04515 [Candidatus Korarchaeota archaeon]
MTGYLRLLRPKNALMSAIGATIGWLTGDHGDLVRYLITAIVPPLVLMGGNAINDFFDFEIDAINKPFRPIPQGIITRREAFLSYLLLSFIGVMLAFSLGWIPFIIALLFVLAWYFYARNLKAKGLVGNIVVSTGVGFTIIFGYISAHGGSILLPITLALIAFSANLAREIVKTVEDLPGDKKAGLSTVPIKFGMKKTKTLIKGLIALTCLLAFVPLFLRLMGSLYLIFSLASVSILLYIFFQTDNLSSENAGIFSKFLKLAMALGLFGMLLDLMIFR